MFAFDCYQKEIQVTSINDSTYFNAVFDSPSIVDHTEGVFSHLGGFIISIALVLSMELCKKGFICGTREAENEITIKVSLHNNHYIETHYHPCNFRFRLGFWLLEFNGDESKICLNS